MQPRFRRDPDEASSQAKDGSALTPPTLSEMRLINNVRRKRSIDEIFERGQKYETAELISGSRDCFGCSICCISHLWGFLRDADSLNNRKPGFFYLIWFNSVPVNSDSLDSAFYSPFQPILSGFINSNRGGGPFAYAARPFILAIWMIVRGTRTRLN